MIFETILSQSGSLDRHDDIVYNSPKEQDPIMRPYLIIRRYIPNFSRYILYSGQQGISPLTYQLYITPVSSKKDEHTCTALYIIAFLLEADR